MFGPKPLTQVCLVLFAGIALPCWTATVGRAAEFDLDLNQLEVTGISDFRGAGGIGHSDKSLFPVELALADVWPPTAAVSSELKVRFAIRNVGNVPVFIPASRDYAQVVKPGVTGRRSAMFGLQVTPVGDFAEPPKPTLSYGGITVGSEEVPGTLVELNPGDVLHVRLTTQLFENEEQRVQDWLAQAETNVVTLRVQAKFAPSEIPDDKLVRVYRHGFFTSPNGIDLLIDLSR